MTLRLRTIAVTIVLGVVSLGLTACVDATRRAHRVTVVAVDMRPPPPRVVVIPAQRRGYVWEPGYWRWTGRKHVWVDGRWMRERRGWQWQPAHWEERQGRWYFQPGVWVRG
jgi:hypothetical protein